MTLLSRVDDARLAELFARCRALLHTGVDDFGMVMVEALAAGKPVLACAEGGALDIVRDGETGLLIDEPTVAAVRAALDRFARASRAFDPALLQRFAQRFDRRTSSAGSSRPSRTRGGSGTPPARTAPTRTARAPTGVRANGGGANGAGTNGAGVATAAAPPTGAPTHDLPRGSAHGAAAASPLSPAGPRARSAPSTSRSPRQGSSSAAPLLAALAALISLDSPGPALFLQRRTGLDQRPFTMVKLRTMDAQGRVTRLGRLLRPTGLDELPQLWNVLKGDMSLIGPRPEVLERVPRHEAFCPTSERATRSVPASPAGRR